jgi:hypothetical protein
MNAEDRQALLRALTELGRRYPHWRFGQLVWNMAGWADAAVWDVEDDRLLAAVTALLDGAPPDFVVARSPNRPTGPTVGLPAQEETVAQPPCRDPETATQRCPPS